MRAHIEPPPLPGDQVGSYRLGDMLGVGGMATVYKATHPEHGLVALKVLHPGKADTEEARRFRREFLTLRELDHPAVVRVFEAGKHGVYPWLAMEYVDGVDLGTLVDRWNAEPPADRFGRVEVIFRDLCEALKAVHVAGLVHRDLKPSNVLVTSGGRAKLTDFGVVKSQGGQFTTQLTVAGKLVGTVAFMAPEQITGEVVDGRADLYSLGAALYVMLTGERPIVADTVAGYLARHLTDDPIPPAEHDPRVPHRLERICLKLLEKDPARRFTDAAEVLARLEQGRSGERAPVYGRDAELSRLLQRFDDLEQRRGGMVVVQGAPRSGRSSLLAELAARVEGRVPVARIAGGQPEPLRALADQLAPVDGDAELRSLPALLARRLRGRPQAVLVDDVDALGRADLEHLTALVRDLLAVHGEPLLVAVTLQSREGASGAFATGAATGLSPEWLTLGGLDRRSVTAIVRDQRVEGAAGAVLGRRLHEELDGMPGAVIEHIDAMVRHGWLQESPRGALILDRDIEVLRQAPLPLPERLKASEQARLQRLALDERSALDALVVLDVEATSDLVADVVGLDMGTVETSLEALQREGMVASRIEGVQEIWRVAGPRSRDLLHGLMDADTRQSLHRSAAAALKRRARRRGNSLSEMIAGHLLRGGLVADAYPLLIRATKRHLRGSRLEDARRLLRQALDARPAAEPRMPAVRAQACRRELFALEGEVLERCGDLTGALGAWERALSAASSGGEQAEVARARSGLGLVRAARGEASAAADGLEQAIQELPQGDPMWTRVAQALATARLVRGDVSGAGRLWTDLEDMGAELGGSLAAEARVGQATVALVRGELRSGQAMLEGAEADLRARPAGRLPLARTLIRLAEMAHADGRLMESAERAAEAGRIARALPRVVLVVRSLGIGAQAHAARGDLVEARRLAREGAALIESRGRVDTAPELLALVSVARGLCAAGQADEAAALMPSAHHYGPAGLDDPTGLLLAVRARARAERDPDGACQDAWGALGRSPASLGWQAGLLAIDAAYALVRAGDDAVDAAIIEALERAEAPGMRLLRLAALNVAARLDLHRDHAAEADLLRQQLYGELGRPAAFLQRWR